MTDTETQTDNNNTQSLLAYSEYPVCCEGREIVPRQNDYPPLGGCQRLAGSAVLWYECGINRLHSAVT